jgi:NAD(P)-dependent dehydrogenase (short-subunit alcohol dehydrogenase family)
VAGRLSNEGCRVVVVDLDGAAAEATAGSLGGAAFGVGADVTTESGVLGYMSSAVERYGRVDCVHLNAGTTGKAGRLVDSSVENFDHVLAVNVRSVYLGLRAAIAQMIGQGSGGGIVATASTASLGGSQEFAPYVASKHAVLGLVRSAALEVARDGIRVNALCPGITDTPMARISETTRVPDDIARARATIEASLPLGRYARPDEMAALVAWLFSDEASYVNGGTLVADGGVSMAIRSFEAPTSTSGVIGEALSADCET